MAAVLAVAGGTAAALLLPGDDPPARLPRDAVPVTVTGATGARISAGYLGVSLEYTALSAYVGRDPGAINPVFVRLLRNLAPRASPVIRVGGDSTDWTWWPVAGVPRPPGVSYTLTPRWVALARALARALDARLVLGINLEADSARLAGAEARALLRGIGSRFISAFELGNEPEAYSTIGWYTNWRGVSIPGRPPDYGVRAYIADYASVSRGLPAGVALAGPALASTGWLQDAGRFLAANPRVRLLTFHFYPLRRCGIPSRSPIYPTIAHLLAPRSAAPAAGVRAAVAAAHRAGVTVRVDELNSVSCKGRPGVSDTFASALWVTEALFELAQDGVDGVNVHTLARVSYAPFAFARRAGRWGARVMPLYYGLLLFGRAAPAGARLLRSEHPPLGGLELWATRGPGSVIRVLFINDSPQTPATLALRAPLARGAGTLQRLRAPGLAATAGVTLAGQTYGQLTTTGRLAGRRRMIAVEPVDGRYPVVVPPASAALLTLGVR